MNTPSIRALLEKPGRTAGTVPAVVTTVPAPEDEYQPYANGRIGNQPQLTLVFRKLDGSVRGFSYSYYYGVESADPADGFVIDYSQAKVAVTGRNLEHLFWLVCAHKAAEIVEATREQVFQVPASSPVVEAISFKKS